MLNQIKVLYSWDYLFILVVQYKVNCYSWRKKLTTEPIDCHWIMYKVRTKILYIVLCKYKNMNLYNVRTKELQCLSTVFSNEHIGVGFCYSFNQKIYIFGSFFSPNAPLQHFSNDENIKNNCFFATFMKLHSREMDF